MSTDYSEDTLVEQPADCQEIGLILINPGPLKFQAAFFNRLESVKIL